MSGPPALIQLLCAVGPGASAAVVRAAAGQIPLRSLVTPARRHGLSGVVRHELERCRLPLDAELDAELRRDALSVAGAALRVKSLLFRTLDALSAAEISPVLLKGYGLASRLYPNPLLRPSSDVDLLVSERELPAARAVVERLGLRFADDPGETDWHAHHHHLGFHGPAGAVELHFRPISGFGGAMEHAHVADRVIEAPLEGRTVRYLAPEDELVHLAAHATQHLFSRLIWLYDLKLLIGRHPGLDWERVVSLAKRSGMGPAVHAAFRAAQVAMALEVPRRVLASLGVAPWQEALERAIFQPEALVGGELPSSKGRAFAVRTLLSGSPSAMARYAADGLERSARRLVATRLSALRSSASR